MGYYPCMENILYDLTFCDPLGINISTPPEALHAILLGHGTHLLNAFARLEKEQKERKRKMMGKKKRNRTVKRKMKKSHKKRRRERILFFWRIWKTGFH